MSPLSTAPALEELLPPLLPPPPPQPDRGAPLLHPFIFYFKLIFRSGASFCPFSQCPSALILRKKSELHPNTLIAHSQPSHSLVAPSAVGRQLRRSLEEPHIQLWNELAPHSRPQVGIPAIRKQFYLNFDF